LHFEKAKEMSTMTWAQRRKSGQSRLRLANWWYQRKEYPIAVRCYKKALQYYNDIPTNRECSSTEEYKELLQLMEERLRVMRQVANIFKRIANMIQSGQISV
jgi:tetratricopeptide (TPR) repeat protein